MSQPASSTFSTAFSLVKQLVVDFEANQKHYLSSGYLEEEARKDFIDKFWMALGWDVNHDTQKNPYEQEVKVERGVKMSEGKKRADYAFYLAPDFQNVQFFVEAKKPSVEIENKDNYFQAIRYGWNAHTPLVVLTDFEQFHILDCRSKPSLDFVMNCAVEKYRYTDYVNEEIFARIYYIFSREAIAVNSIQKYVEKHLNKPQSGKARQRGLFSIGMQSIDEAFLLELVS
jgi:adenine-specific DNA-methyltransferase